LIDLAIDLTCKILIQKGQLYKIKRIRRALGEGSW
jgi:hypothetical protein